MPEKEYGKVTLDLIQELKSKGINRMVVIIRHSARHYDQEHPENEPFFTLTDAGREYAYEMGRSLSPGFTVSLHSSIVSRCIETAYLIDKGYVSQNGQTLHNVPEDFLSPFYIRKPFELANVLKTTYPNFVRHWFDGHIPTEIIDPPQYAAQSIITRLAEKLYTSAENHISLGVTHDWNLYLIKEQIMGLKHEEIGRVSYLEGLIAYCDQGKGYIINHQTEPVKLLISG